jgi:ribonuclease Z
MLLHRAGVSILKIDNIFISHLHGDHCLGIFGLLSSMGMKGRTSRLTIHAPAAFKGILDFFRESFEGDSLKYEIVHNVLGSASDDCAIQKVFESRNIEVYSFPLHHRVPTFGFLFKEKEPALNVRKECIEQYGITLKEIGTLKRGEDVVREDGTVLANVEMTYRPFKPRSFAYCSDTAPFRGLKNIVEGVDLLYHEATFASELKEMAKSTFHSTASDAATVAKDANVGKLVIGHFSSRYSSVHHLKDEAAEIFENVYLAEKGAKFDVELIKYR